MTLTLADVEQTVINCQACSLSSTCQGPLPIQSRKSSRYLIINDAPGTVDDKNRQHLTGRVGQVLKDNLRYAGLGVSPSDYEAMGLIACYPGTDGPTADSIRACTSNFQYQWEVSQSTYVLALGANVLKRLLPHAELSYIMGLPIPCKGKVIVPVYHPSYIIFKHEHKDIWRRHLLSFAKMVKHNRHPTLDQLGATHCLYCTRGREYNELTHNLTCHQHIKTYLADSVWPEIKRKRNTPKQVETLF